MFSLCIPCLLEFNLFELWLWHHILNKEDSCYHSHVILILHLYMYTLESFTSLICFILETRIIPCEDACNQAGWRWCFIACLWNTSQSNIWKNGLCFLSLTTLHFFQTKRSTTLGVAKQRPAGQMRPAIRLLLARVKFWECNCISVCLVYLHIVNFCKR